jgi:adenylate cyclase
LPEETLAHDEENWRKALTEGETVPRVMRRLFGTLPANPRCKMCNAPFKGAGAPVMRLIGRRQSSKNPRYCEPCAFDETGGAEVEISMLFADVRGSTVIAETMRPGQYTLLIQRFYEAATSVLVHHDALIDRLMGDEVIGLFVPAFAGPWHARRAVHAAQELRRRLGYLDPNGPWLPAGIGVHTGPTFVGVVQGGPDGLKDFTVLGDSVNTTARLASAAAGGEILISDAAHAGAGLHLGQLEHRELALKGKAQPVGVHVIAAPPNLRPPK